MSVINRKDGTEFIIKPIREVVEAKGRRALLSEIRGFSKEYGDYCHVRRLVENRYALTFHLDGGYLLGEAVADYFDHPDNLLWCEEIGQGGDGETRVAIVIIRGHQIMLDAEMPATAVADDISLALGGGEEAFAVYTFGNVPVKQDSDQADFNDVVLDVSRVEQFTVLQQGIIELLETKPEYLLTTPHTALRNAGFKNYGLTVVLLFLALAPAGYYFATDDEAEKEVVVIDNYKGYRAAALSDTKPASILLSLDYYFRAFQSLPNWQLKQVISTGEQLSYRLTSVTQKYDRLFAFADKHSGRLTIDNSESILVLPALKMERPGSDLITSELAVTTQLAEAVSNNPVMSVVTGASSSTGHYQSREIKIDVKEASNADLQWLAGVIDGYPISITEMNLTVSNYALNGYIKLNTYGY